MRLIRITSVWNSISCYLIILSIGSIGMGYLTNIWSFNYLGFVLLVLGVLILLIIEKYVMPPFYRASAQRLRAGNVNEALELINRSIEACPNFYPSYALRSYLYLCKKQLAEAKEDAELVIRLEPDNWYGYRTFGQWFLFQGRYAEAIEPFSEALRLAPKESVNHCTLGATYYRLKDFEKAVECLQRAVSIKSSKSCALSSHYYLGCSFAELGQEEKAIDVFDEMRKKYSKGLKAWENDYGPLPDDYPAIEAGKKDIEEVKEMLRAS